MVRRFQRTFVREHFRKLGGGRVTIVKKHRRRYLGAEDSGLKTIFRMKLKKPKKSRFTKRTITDQWFGFVDDSGKMYDAEIYGYLELGSENWFVNYRVTNKKDGLVVHETSIGKANSKEGALSVAKQGEILYNQLPDTDKDKVPDRDDCDPKNPKRQDFDAKTVVQQLGGNRFIAMTGAKNFVRGKDFVAFSIPQAKEGINRVKISYDFGTDLYTMEFASQRIVKGELSYKVKAEATGVYFDQLEDIFEQKTGLFTRFR